MRVAGRWVEPTLTGPRSVTIEGVTYSLPDGVVCRLVTAGKVTFLHAKVGREVFVLCPRLGMLDESPDERRARAFPNHWSAVEGEPVVVH